MDKKQSNRVVVYLDSEQRKNLDKLSAKTGAPLSEILRRAVDGYVKKEVR